MGIKGLTKLLADNSPHRMKEQKLESHFGRKTAIDAIMSIYQLLRVMGRTGSELLTNEAGGVTGHLQGMFNRTIRVLEAGMKPVYVFDGKPPDLKKGERVLGFEQVYAVATEDMDSLTFGSPRFLRHLMEPTSRKIPVMEFDVLKGESSRTLTPSTCGHFRRFIPAASPHWRSPQGAFTRSLNIFTVFNKEARAKEQARLQDELNRGYFDDLRDIKKTGGKVAAASTSLTPIAASPKFPSLEVHIPKGPALTLPFEDGKHSGVTLMCMSFRASAQSMVLSWSLPFAQKLCSSKFSDSIQVFEVSVIESSVLSFWPIKRLLLRTMRGADASKGAEELERKVVYAFGDTYFLRKTLGIPNLLSGYVFLLDTKGRVRWRASGMATEVELASMVSCTLRLLEEEASKATKTHD